MTSAYRFACVVLGAGAGTRFGEPKAGARLADGVRFLDAVVSTARDAGADPIVAVVPPGLAVPSGLVRVENHRAAAEAVTSVRLGLAALANAPVASTLLWPVDHPFVHVDSLLALIDAHRRTTLSIVLPVYQRRRGHPALFARSVWSELMAVAEGEGGARVVVHRHESAGDLAVVDVSDDGVIRNVDTRADLRAGTPRTGDAIS